MPGVISFFISVGSLLNSTLALIKRRMAWQIFLFCAGVGLPWSSETNFWTMRQCGRNFWEQHSKEEWCGTSQRKKNVRNPSTEMTGRPGYIPAGNVYNWSKHTTLPTSQSPWTNISISIFESSSCRDLCLRTQLTGLRPSVATHFWGGVCLLFVVALDLEGFYITLVSNKFTNWAVIQMGEKWEKGGSTVKIGLENSSILHWFFFDAEKVLVYIRSVACHWLQSKYQNVKPHTHEITQGMLIDHANCMLLWGGTWWCEGGWLTRFYLEVCHVNVKYVCAAAQTTGCWRWPRW